MNKQQIKAAVSTAVLGVMSPLIMVMPASAATVTWTGATDDKINTATNWSGGVAPMDGDTVEFPASGFSGNTDNDATSLSLAKILFNGDNAGTSSWNYVISGNDLTITSSIEAIMTGSAGEQSIITNVTLDADVTFKTTGSNSLSIGADIPGSNKGGGGVYTLDLGTNDLTIDASGGTISLLGIIEGSGNIIKTGDGKVNIQGTTDDFTGATQLTAGELVATEFTTGNIVVNGGTLKGVSDLLGNVSMSDGNISPGLSPGCLGVSDLDLTGGNFNVEIGGTTVCTEYDSIAVDAGGTPTLGASTTLNVSLINDFNPAVNDVFAIITNDGSNPDVTGTFVGLENGDKFTQDEYTFQINYDAGTDGKNVVLLVTGTPSAPDTGVGTLISSPVATLIAAMAVAGAIYGIRYAENKRSK